MTIQRPEMNDRSVASDVRLLILDDDPLVGDTVGMMAKSLGATYIYCQAAQDFFAQINTFNPTHIVLDLVMPGVDGIRIIQSLGESGCDAELIIASGVDSRVLDAAQRSVQQHGLSLAGALPKPFSRAALATLLERRSDAPVDQLPKAVRHAAPSSDELKAALMAGDIGPVFQPKVRCNDGSLVGYEALARWTRGERDICGPDIFVPIAEQSGCAFSLTEVIVRKSLQWLGTNFLETSQTVAVNVPAICLENDDAIRMIEAACSEFGIAPERIILEVTESGAIDPNSGALDVLTRARLAGMKLSIDDFGVGYSSLVQLARMPFSEIKIDRSFVADLCHSSEAQAIIAAIVGMSDGLGMTTVAEGVENLDTYMRLRDMGCDVAQGYFIGRPMTASRAVAWSDVK
jgi:EAL domain-containing protein (putative c-di-GMP-specific phosphodiesterase class I)/FixJ family two-component response regulator